MQHAACTHKFLAKVILLSIMLVASLPVLVYADVDQATALAELKTNQAKMTEAQAGKDLAVKARDALAAQQASKPDPDTERKLKDAETDVMLADSKLNSAKKSVERAQKKLDESSGDTKTAAPAVKVESPAVVIEAPAKKVADEQLRKEAEAKAAAQKASEERSRKEAEAKVAAQKASEEQVRKEAEAKVAAQKASEERSRKEAEAILAAQKASEEAAKKVAEAEAAAKKQALAAELGIDKNCIALPTNPTTPSASVNATDQAYAQGFLKQINLLVEKKTADDVPPLALTPVLEGTKLSPCDPNQKLALKFGYMGNGQYRVETPVLAGEQIFSVKNVIQALNRVIPESDNGEVYVFFLDGREGRTKLTAYKKSLLEQAP